MLAIVAEILVARHLKTAEQIVNALGEAALSGDRGK